MKGGEAMEAAESEADAWVTAAAMQLTRDELWKRKPALDPDCEHDLLCLLCIEIRQTVLCRKCGGLDAEASRRVLGAPTRRADDGILIAVLDSGQRVTLEENRGEEEAG